MVLEPDTEQWVNEDVGLPKGPTLVGEGNETFLINVETYLSLVDIGWRVEDESGGLEWLQMASEPNTKWWVSEDAGPLGRGL